MTTSFGLPLPLNTLTNQNTNTTTTTSTTNTTNTTTTPDEPDTFEIFDPRGLFSPPTSTSNQLSSDNLIWIKNHQAGSPSSPSQPISPSFDFQLTPWSTTTQTNTTTQHPTTTTGQPTKHIHPLNSSSPNFNPTPPSYKLPQETTPRMISPVESPISPCSSLPFCRSPPPSLLMNQSTSLTRGRSPPPRFLSEPHSSPSPPSSATSSLSPPQHPASTIHPLPPHSRHNHPSSHHRPTPIVTSGIRDSSLPSRLSYLRSDDRLDSVSSLAYSDMDASPAVNFLSAFADATIPSIRTEMSPIPTVPSEVLEEGDQVAGYIFGQIIGRGGFSVVREARHSITDQRVAVKIVRRSPTTNLPRTSQPKSRFPPQPVSLHASISSRDRSSSVAMTVNGHLVNSAHLPLPTSATEDLANALLKQEIRVWSNLSSHPNLVPLLSLHETPTQTLLFMPMCEGGNLLQLLNQVKLNPHEQDQLYQVFNWPSFNSFGSPSLGTSTSITPSSGGLRLDLVRPIFWQIVQGLTYLHNEAGIVHKDIKLENILIQKGQIKISDFGLATYPTPGRPIDPSRVAKGKSSSSLNRDLSLPKIFSALPRINEGRISGGVDPRSMTWSLSHNPHSRLPPKLDNSFFSSQPVKEDDDDDISRQEDDPLCSVDMFPTAAGSLAYTPPEQLRSEIPLACPSLDIWALGCVLYGLLEGHLPFQDDFEPRLRLKIMNGQFDFPPTLVVKPEETSETEAEQKMMVAKVLKGCLAVDRNSRWVVSEIGSTPWLERRQAQGHSRGGTTSDDSGQSSSDAPLDELSMSKRSASASSSAASAWSVDELSLVLDPEPCSNNKPTLSPSGLDSDQMVIGSCPTTFEAILPLCTRPGSSTSPPLDNSDLMDLHSLLTTVPSESSPSIPLSPPLIGLDRPARSRRRPHAYDRHHLNRTIHPVPRSPPPVGMPSISRSRSRNRGPFCPPK